MQYQTEKTCTFSWLLESVCVLYRWYLEIRTVHMPTFTCSIMCEKIEIWARQVCRSSTHESITCYSIRCWFIGNMLYISSVVHFNTIAQMSKREVVWAQASNFSTQIMQHV